MPVIHTGPTCARRGCSCPVWMDRLCNRCWRLAKLFGRDPKMFVYEPLHGWSDECAGLELPWDRWTEEAAKRGLSVAELLAEGRSSEQDQGESAR